MNEKTLARGLGWFSLGLGLTELLGARTLARFLGTNSRSGALRVFGLREIGAGVGILAADEADRPLAPWLWARVAGDALDLAALAAALRDNPQRPNVIFALGSVAAVTALDVLCAQALQEQED